MSPFHRLKAIKQKLRYPGRYDYYEDYIRRAAPGKTFLDMGAMWLVHGRFSFFAEEAGAAEVTAFDILHPSPEFQETHTSKSSKVRTVHGDLMNDASIDALGQFDVVFCSGVLYHLPDPISGLEKIRRLTRGKAMIGTAVIPDGLTPGQAIYYPYRKLFVHRFPWIKKTFGKWITDCPAEYKPDEGYANWFWGMSPSCVEAMLRTAGFRVVRVHHRLHYAYFECEVGA